MSYILDALRRLEQDKERTKRGANPMEAVLVPDLQEGEKPERRRLGWVVVGVALLVAAIAATYWITRRTLVPPAERARERTVPHLASARPGYDRSAPPSSPEAPPSSSQRLSSGRERTIPPPSRAAFASPGAPPGPAPASKPAEGSDRSLPKAEPIPIQAGERHRPVVPAGEGSLPALQEDRAMLRDASEGEVIQVWRGSEIKINAIAFSRDGRNRFAVVNLKPVHEGDQVEDLTVAEIQEDGIVFEKGGKKYRVLLGKR